MFFLKRNPNILKTGDAKISFLFISFVFFILKTEVFFFNFFSYLWQQIPQWTLILSTLNSTVAHISNKIFTTAVIILFCQICFKCLETTLDPSAKDFFMKKGRVKGL